MLTGHYVTIYNLYLTTASTHYILAFLAIDAPVGGTSFLNSLKRIAWLEVRVSSLFGVNLTIPQAETMPPQTRRQVDITDSF
jgi:hypothetical protein